MQHVARFMVHGLVPDRSGGRGVLTATGGAVGAAHPQIHDSVQLF